ncbi:MAG: hypothetical protein WBF77_01775 [Sulfurimonadaceae bacterium]
MFKLIKYRIATVILALTIAPVTQALAEGSWTVSPHVWWINASVEDSGDDLNHVNSWKDVQFVMYGLSVEYAPSFQENFSYILTYYTSSGYTTEIIDISVWPGGSNSGVTTFTQENSDFELFVRYRVPDSIFNLTVGYRRLDIEGEAPNATSRYEANSNLFEVGIGLATPMFKDSDRHHLFANLTYGIGKTDMHNGQGKEHTTTLDNNIGYQFLVKDDLSVHVRYRSFWNEKDHSEGEIRTTYEGVELGMGYSF